MISFLLTQILPSYFHSSNPILWLSIITTKYSCIQNSTCDLTVSSSNPTNNTGTQLVCMPLYMPFRLDQWILLFGYERSQLCIGDSTTGCCVYLEDSDRMSWLMTLLICNMMALLDVVKRRCWCIVGGSRPMEKCIFPQTFPVFCFSLHPVPQVER